MLFDVELDHDGQLEIITLSSEVSHHELHLREPRLVALWTLPPRDSLVYRMVRLVMTELPSCINRTHPGYAAEERSSHRVR